MRANASNLFLARNFSLDAVTMTAYGIVGSVRIDMVYWFSLVDLFRCFLFAEFCFLISRSSDAYSETGIVSFRKAVQRFPFFGRDSFRRCRSTFFASW